MIPYLNNVKLHCSMANVSYREQPSSHVFMTFPNCNVISLRHALNSLFSEYALVLSRCEI